MTRATLFRVILAMRLLPNFTAYWWMLPRRMKRWRTASEFLSWRLRRVAIEGIFNRCESFQKRFQFLETTPISDHFYRIPVRLFRSVE